MIKLFVSFSHLEFLQLGLGNRVSFGNDGNNVDLGVQLLHAHQIQRFQAVASGADEVQADVDAAVVIRRQRAFDLQFLLKIRFELCVEVVDDSFEGIVLVDLVTVADGVADRQLQTNVALLQLVGLCLQFHSWQRVRTGGGLEVGVEQRVHQRAFAQTSLTHAQNIEYEAILDAFVDQLIGKTIKSNMPRQL